MNTYIGLFCGKKPMKKCSAVERSLDYMVLWQKEPYIRGHIFFRVYMYMCMYYTHIQLCVRAIFARVNICHVYVHICIYM